MNKYIRPASLTILLESTFVPNHTFVRLHFCYLHNKSSISILGKSESVGRLYDLSKYDLMKLAILMWFDSPMQLKGKAVIALAAPVIVVFLFFHHKSIWVSTYFRTGQLKQKSLKSFDLRLFLFQVAGAGLEPTTFGL
jgi:hypothetical protein